MGSAALRAWNSLCKTRPMRRESTAGARPDADSERLTCGIRDEAAAEQREFHVPRCVGSRLFASLMRALIALGVVGCSSDPNIPCFEFVELGRTYEITLLAQLAREDVRPLEEPYHNFITRPSCGTTFDIQTGDVVPLNAERRGPQEHEYSCFYVNGRIDTINNLELGERAPPPAGNIDFVESRQAVHSSGCEGVWSFGIATVQEQFKAQHPELNATRFMAYRNFYRSGDAACAQLFSDTVACNDHWFTTVRDDSGVIVAP